jgi:pimeloyl-ACP methyl ester carboxylesterase
MTHPRSARVTTSLHATGSIRFFHRLTRRAAILGGVASLAALGGRQGAAQVATPPAASPSPASGDIAGLVDIGGGRQMYLECRGEGGPTVVLEAGYRNNAELWDTVALPDGVAGPAVWPGVAAFTRVCAYDRPGTIGVGVSRSDPAPQPRTTADAVADLHALLTAAQVPGPYVLVGHSLGGLIVRLYASTYPDDVAGLVLVDALPEGLWEGLQAALTPAQWDLYYQLSTQAPAGLEDDPELEWVNFEESFVQVSDAAATVPLRPMPLVVLSYGRPLESELPPDALPPDYPFDTFDRVRAEHQRALATLVPDARFVVATESGHYIHVQQPDLVIEAVHQVVAAVREPSSWAAPEASPSPAS